MIKADPDNVVVATDPIVKNRNILNELDKLHPSQRYYYPRDPETRRQISESQRSI